MLSSFRFSGSFFWSQYGRSPVPIPTKSNFLSTTTYILHFSRTESKYPPTATFIRDVSIPQATSLPQTRILLIKTKIYLYIFPDDDDGDDEESGVDYDGSILKTEWTDYVLIIPFF